MSQDKELENMREEILKVMSTNEKSGKAERLIEEFAKRVIDQPDPRESFHWLTTRAHELGHSGSAEDLDQAISANYFALGFVFSWLAAKRLDLMRMSKYFSKT